MDLNENDGKDLYKLLAPPDLKDLGREIPDKADASSLSSERDPGAPENLPNVRYKRRRRIRAPELPAKALQPY